MGRLFRTKGNAHRASGGQSSFFLHPRSCLAWILRLGATGAHRGCPWGGCQGPGEPLHTPLSPGQAVGALARAAPPAGLHVQVMGSSNAIRGSGQIREIRGRRSGRWEVDAGMPGRAAAATGPMVERDPHRRDPARHTGAGGVRVSPPGRAGGSRGVLG